MLRWFGSVVVVTRSSVKSFEFLVRNCAKLADTLSSLLDDNFDDELP